MRFWLAGMGLAGIVLGVFVLPALVPGSVGVWIGTLVTPAGWLAIMLFVGEEAIRFIRPALVLSAVTAVGVGFFLVFGIPLLGDSAPRTLGMTAVLFGVLALGWTVAKGSGPAATLLASSLAGLALLAQAIVTAAPAIVTSEPTNDPSVIVNSGRWSTLALCALASVLAGRSKTTRNA